MNGVINRNSASSTMEQVALKMEEFNLFRQFIYDHAGITLSDDKQALVSARLHKRLRHYGCRTYSEYFELVLTSPDNERQVAIDLLTTNETYFFREPKHFLFLEEHVVPHWPTHKTIRVWSAASSSGEEAYSIAMLLDDLMTNDKWEVFGSDISTRVLQQASKGLYKTDRIEGIPQAYLKKYCLKGKGEYDNALLVDRKLRQRVNFAQINLTQPLAEIGSFDVIFLRNILIYFNAERKNKIVRQVLEKLNPGGYLFIGHSETLKDMRNGLTMVAPAIYQKA